MRQSKKLLSVLLAVVMVFSTVAIAASAYAPWKDEAIAGQYDGMDKPVLTTEQYASAALDEVDRMLNEEQIMLTADDIFVGNLDLRSIDKALDSVQELLKGSLWNQFGPMLGDLSKLDASALEKPRRSAKTADADLQVIYALLEFLYDNKGIFTGVIDGSIDLGSLVGPLLEGLLGGPLDVTPLIKGLLYELVYEKDAPETITETVDDMAQHLIDKFVVGYVDADGTFVEGLVPALEGYTNISKGSTYDFVDNILKVLYNELLVPMANEKWLGAINDMLADNADVIEGYTKFFNLTAEGTCNFTFQNYTFTDDMTFMGELNNIIASIVNVLISDELGFDWSTGPNSQIVPNIIKFGREVLAQTGDTFFASFVEVKTAEELAAMTDMQVVSYVARAIINSSVDGVWIPESAETLVEVANYTVKGIVAIDLPGRDYSDLSVYPNDSVDTIYNVLADYAAEALNDLFDIGIEYGTSIDDVLTQIVNWAIPKYAGLLSGINLSTSDSGWKNIDKILFTIFNRNWFDASLFPSGTVNFEELIKKVIFENLLSLNFDGLISILTTEVEGSELQKPIKQVILNLLPRTINIVFPNLLATNMTTLEDIIKKENLAGTVNALFTDLYSYRVTLAAAVLPIVCPILDLTNPQEFEAPEFTLDSFYYISTAPNFQVTITNPSSGINTGYTDASGFHQDSRYAIKINSVKSSVSTVTVSTPAQTTLDGGESTTFTVGGSFTGTQPIVFTINYDVLVEDGSKLTAQPLDARIYSCLSKTDTDEAKTAAKSASGVAASIVDGNMNLYRTDISGLDDLSSRVKNNNEMDENNPNAGAVTVKPYAITTTATSIGKLSFMEANTEEVEIKAGFQADIEPFKFKEAYGEYTEEQLEAAKLEAFSANGFKRYYQNVGVTVGTTNLTYQGNICLYDDFGLPGLFNSEVNAQRQAYDYTDSAAWTAYLAAMDAASALINGKRTAATFCNATSGDAKKFKTVSESLEAAIETLEASAAGGGAQSTYDLLESISPSNEEGVEYDAPNFNYFGKDDYVAYTYENYRSARNDANGLVESAKIYKTVINEETGEEEIVDYEDFTYGPVDSLSVAYTNHRLSLYAGRLVKTPSLKTNLNIAVANANAAGYNEDDYTEDSWNNYSRAIAFATSVNNEEAPRQTKINEAYVQLIEAQKRLMKGEGGSGSGDEVVVEIAGANPGDNGYSLVVEETTFGKLLLGAFPGDVVADVAEYFNITGDATVECDAIATGSTITISDANGNVIDEYVIVITGELNGDGTVNASDSTVLNKVAAGLAEFSATADSAFDFAADMDNSAIVNASDATALDKVAAGLAEINYADRG